MQTNCKENNVAELMLKPDNFWHGMSEEQKRTNENELRVNSASLPEPKRTSFLQKFGLKP
jgi:hypothetical protein